MQYVLLMGNNTKIGEVQVSSCLDFKKVNRVHKLCESNGNSNYGC